MIGQDDRFVFTETAGPPCTPRTCPPCSLPPCDVSLHCPPRALICLKLLHLPQCPPLLLYPGSGCLAIALARTALLSPLCAPHNGCRHRRPTSTELMIEIFFMCAHTAVPAPPPCSHIPQRHMRLTVPLSHGANWNAHATHATVLFSPAPAAPTRRLQTQPA